jgi:hypothetical protein
VQIDRPAERRKKRVGASGPSAVGASFHFQMENVEAMLLPLARPREKTTEPTDEKRVAH